MAHIVTDSVKNIKKAVMGSQDVKQAQLAQSTIEPTKDSRLTTDFGTKQTSADDWLRVNSENQIGPGLLEDNFGRERV